MMATVGRMALAGSLLLALGAADAAGILYRCDLLDARHWDASGGALNASGEVAGWNAGAARWSRNGRRTELPGVIPGEASDALGIDRSGRVVGVSGVFGVPGLPTVWVRNVPAALPLLPGGTRGEATTLNDAGLIAGASSFDGGEVMHGVVWAGGAPADQGALGDVDAQARRESVILGMNQAGERVGFSAYDDAGHRHAVLWGTDGRIVDLGALPGSAESAARAINAAGTVVGSSTLAGAAVTGSRPVVWIDRTLRALALQPGQATGAARAINTAGHIVGANNDAVEIADAKFAFIGTALTWRRADQAPIDLNTVTQRCANHSRAFFAERLVDAVGINDKGVILARFQGLERSRGWYFRPALLTPVP